MRERLIKWKLGILARLYLWKYKPMIIGVTGNAGKTSTKEIIGKVVGHIKKVRVATGNLNNELGLPLTIIGGWDEQYYSKGPSIWFWSKVLLSGYFKLFFGDDYPQVLVLEYGADHPGDIHKLASKFKPHIAVITNVGDVPVHVEFFKDAEAVAEEKANLVRVLTNADFAVLNHDDHRVFGMSSKTKAHVLTYGFGEGSTFRVSDFDYLSNEEGQPLGVTFKLNGGSHFAPVRIMGSLGKSQAWSVAAAAAVGSILGMNLVEVNDSLANYEGPKGRLKILNGINHSNIIDDTYNASPASTHLALEALRDIPALRKIAVLGDMLELGNHSEKAHQDIGLFASEVADILVCVGPKAKAIAKATTGKIPSDRIYSFDKSTEAINKARDLIKEHDLVLVKGSQGMRMEKIVKAILSEPDKARELLVRQSDKWLAK